jgi:hypothetical protein
MIRVSKGLLLGLGMVLSVTASAQTWRDSSGTVVGGADVNTSANGAINYSTRKTEVKAPSLVKLNSDDVIMVSDEVMRLAEELGISPNQKLVATCSTAKVNYEAFKAPMTFQKDENPERYSAIMRGGLSGQPSNGLVYAGEKNGGWVKNSGRKGSSNTTIGSSSENMATAVVLEWKKWGRVEKFCPPVTNKYDDFPCTYTSLPGTAGGLSRASISSKVKTILDEADIKELVVIDPIHLIFEISIGGYKLTAGGEVIFDNLSDLSTGANTIITYSDLSVEGVLADPKYYISGFKTSGKYWDLGEDFSNKSMIAPFSELQYISEGGLKKIPKLIDWRLGFTSTDRGTLERKAIFRGMKHVVSAGAYTKQVQINLDVATFKRSNGSLGSPSVGYTYNVKADTTATHENRNRYGPTNKLPLSGLRIPEVDFNDTSGDIKVGVGVNTGFNQTLICNFGDPVDL